LPTCILCQWMLVTVLLIPMDNSSSPSAPGLRVKHGRRISGVGVERILSPSFEGIRSIPPYSGRLIPLMTCIGGMPYTSKTTTILMLPHGSLNILLVTFPADTSARFPPSPLLFLYIRFDLSGHFLPAHFYYALSSSRTHTYTSDI